MLEELSTINWQQLTHAYRAADDVPEQIRALASNDEEARKKALYHLYDHFDHQGTGYEIATYAVPFLIELLQHEQVQQREDILVLLVHIAEGFAYTNTIQTLELFQQTCNVDVQSGEWQTLLDQELSWIQKAREAVRKGVPVYLELMGHSDPALRTAAAYAVATFQDDDGTLTQMLWEALPKEEDTVTQASIILGLGLSQQTELPIQAHLTDLINYTTDVLIKTTASMSLVRLAQQETPHEALVALIEAMKYPKSITETYNQLPWAREGVIADVSACLQWLGGSRAKFAIPELVQMVDFANPYEASIIQTTAEHMALHAMAVGEATEFPELDDLRQRKLMALDSDDMGMYAQSQAEDVAERSVSAHLKMLDTTNPYGALAVKDPNNVLNIARTLVSLAFGVSPNDEGTQFHELNDLQQRTLTAIDTMGIEAIWNTSDDDMVLSLPEIMESFNLPDGPDKLHTFAQGTPAP